MIMNYKTFENKFEKIPMVGLPSGEFIELTLDQFSTLNELRYLKYDSRMKTFVFEDSDYKNIMYYLRDRENDKIINFMKAIGIRKYKIHDDRTVDVWEDVSLKLNILTIPVKFEYVTGDFDVSFCGLINLNGCPNTVEGNFICTNNRLTDLKGGPDVVTGSYDVSHSNLASLDGSPSKINVNFNCGYNKLANLKGGPRVVNGSYSCTNNLLISLDGSPDILIGNFNCSGNYLQTLKDGPDLINGIYDCSFNDLESLKDGPNSVGVFNCLGNRRLKESDFYYAPIEGKIIKDEKPK